MINPDDLILAYAEWIQRFPSPPEGIIVSDSSGLYSAYREACKRLASHKGITLGKENVGTITVYSDGHVEEDFK